LANHDFEMSRWRSALYALMARTKMGVIRYSNLPPARDVVQIEV
jgi:hypothetical protein